MPRVSAWGVLQQIIKKSRGGKPLRDFYILSVRQGKREKTYNKQAPAGAPSLVFEVALQEKMSAHSDPVQ